jgi:protein-glucosylgalactosylhydroxylysine glucosidase
MSEPLSPAPLRDYRPEYIPAYIANGLIGLRVPRIPFQRGTAMVNGFAGIDVNDGVEGFARVPFPLGADIQVDGVWLTNATHLVRFVEQRYDFGRAELTTELEFRVHDITARIEILQFCSHTEPTVVAMELRVSVDRATDLAMSGGIDPTGVPGSPTYADSPVGRETPTPPDALMVWTSPGDIARCGIAYRTELLGATDADRSTIRFDQGGMMATSYRFRARRDRPYRLRLTTSLVPELAHPHPGDQASSLLAQATRIGWERMRDNHEAAWVELWRGRIELGGAERRWQAITDASLFYLLTSVHPASIASTSLFGLAYWPNYHYYRGHVMWDIETFALPPLLLTEPAAARSMLDYRFRHLDAARTNARTSGHAGAMYPWESCPLHGEECTPGATAPTQGHATIDVALAFAQYVHATGDLDYLQRTAWPVIQAVAEWIESRVTPSPRGFEIRDVTGPAETEPPVNNNAFVNMAAAQLLKEATGFSDQLGIPPHRRWSAIADGLVVPRMTRGVLANHDDYRLNEDQGGTPEAAAGLFPIGYSVEPDVERGTFRFAAEEQAPSYVGTPMLSAFLAYYAAQAGDRRRSAELLESGYETFLNEPWMEIDEFPRHQRDKPRCGPMFANIGGFLTTLLYGYPGLRLGAGDPLTWCERSVVMPDGWRSIHVERLRVRGDEMSLTAEDGQPSAILDGHRLRRVS